MIAEISPEEDENTLPAYEDAWRSAPYDPAQLEALVARGDLPPSIAISAPNELASGATTLLSSSDTEDETDSNRVSNSSDNLLSVPWEGVDLSRVPSYTTAIRSNRLYSFSGSLPGYESVAVPGRTA